MFFLVILTLLCHVVSGGVISEQPLSPNFKSPYFQVEQPLSQQTNPNFSLPVLGSSKVGRHFLLISLLDELQHPYWYPRAGGLLRLVLPPSLASPDQPTYLLQDSQKLPGIKSEAGDLLTREEVISMLNDLDDFLFIPGKKFSRFNQVQMEEVRKLVDLLASQVNFDSMYTMLVMLKEFLPVEVFVDTVYSLVQKRKDVGFIIPSHVSVQPEDYFPGEVLDKANMAAASYRRVKRQTVGWARGYAVDITMNRENFQTMPDSEPESKLWYFSEDPLVNANHFHWHQVVSNLDVVNDDPSHSSNLDRRGEMFYFMHRQLLCRANLERLSVGLPVSTPYGPEEWAKPVYPGYDSKLGLGSVNTYGARPAGAVMYATDARKMKKYEDTLMRAINLGYLVMKESNVKLEYVGGVDKGISKLGDVIESYSRSIYGDLHNTGHTAISDMSGGTWPHGDNGVMATPNVALRDPIFSRWHKYVDDIFLHYKNKFGPYTDQDLDFVGVKLSSVSLMSEGADYSNILYTYMNKSAEAHISSLDLSKVGSSSVMIHYTSLDNMPFTYNIRVEATIRTSGLIRIFLIPAEIPRGPYVEISQLAVEMDRFYVDLIPGGNTLTRKSKESTFLAKNRFSLHELQKMLIQGEISEDQFNWGGCGWPEHMLIPRGKEEGMPFSLFVVLSPFLADDSAHRADWSTHNTGTWSWCGVRTDKGGMPDSRPMGFPMDRSPARGDWTSLLKGKYGEPRSNMANLPITILHMP